MKTFVAICVIVFATVTGVTSSSAQRPVQPIYNPFIILFLAPPLAVTYDLYRRVHCLNPPDPLGLGGPGFSEPPNPASTVMIPKCYRMMR